MRSHIRSQLLGKFSHYASVPLAPFIGWSLASVPWENIQNEKLAHPNQWMPVDLANWKLDLQVLVAISHSRCPENLPNPSGLKGANPDSFPVESWSWQSGAWTKLCFWDGGQNFLSRFSLPFNLITPRLFPNIPMPQFRRHDRADMWVKRCNGAGM